jgi:DNA polymerase kappa
LLWLIEEHVYVCVTNFYALFCIYQVQTSDNDDPSSNHSGCTEVLGSTSFQGLFEGKNANNESILQEDDKLNSSCQETIMLWLDDYKCSLCGTELPPSFVEERLEHADFHFAEKLQKEESSIRQASTPIQR